MSDFDRRLGDWLEDGVQSVPDWVVEDALQRAHVTPQLGRGFHWPWIRPQLGIPPLSRMVPLALGAAAGLAVVSAFVLGLLSAPRIGDEPPPSPEPSPATSRPTSALPRPVQGLQAIDVLPGDGGQVYALIGLAATADAVWTVAVLADEATGDPVSRLVRIEAGSGVAQIVELPGVIGMLSPPVADGEVVWTGSAAGLHAADATGAGEPRTVALGFQPLEIAVAPDGLWVARSGGSSLVDRQTGDVLREVATHAGSRLGRIVGAPLFGSLWECAAGALLRVDPNSGDAVATVELPADEGERCRHAISVTGVNGVAEGVVPRFSNLVVGAATTTVALEFDLGGDWSDMLNVDGRAWFEVAIRGSGGLALVELDPATGRPSQTLTFPGVGYSNTTYQSRSLADAGGYVWVLADPTPDSADGPQIVRIPRSELAHP